MFRALFIFSGVELIKLSYLPPINVGGKWLEINLILTIFGFFLIWAGVKSALPKEEHTNDDFGKSLGLVSSENSFLFPIIITMTSLSLNTKTIGLVRDCCWFWPL